MKLKSFAALMMAGVMALGLCACNSEAPDTSGSDTTPVSISTTESWDFSTGFYPPLPTVLTDSPTTPVTAMIRSLFGKAVNLRQGWPKRGTSVMMD